MISTALTSPPTLAVNDNLNPPTLVVLDASGIVITDVGITTQDEANAVLLGSDGSLIVIGDSSDVNGVYSDQVNLDQFGIARYNADGSLDTSFASNGTLRADFGFQPPSADLSTGVGSAYAVQPDGKLLLTGWTDGFEWVRLNADGSPDTSLGNGGIVNTNINNSYTQSKALTLQADGKVVVAGTTYDDAQGGPALALARYNADGSLDLSFANGGIDIVSGIIAVDPSSVRVDANGSILVAGAATNAGTSAFELVRLNADGSLDPNFGDGGQVLTEIGAGSGLDNGRYIVVQDDGKILVAGEHFDLTTFSASFVLVRYNADGSLDTDFGGGDGIVGAPVGDFVVAADSFSIALQSDGSIVAMGAQVDPGAADLAVDFAIWRYTPGGDLDTSFGVNGSVATPVGPLNLAYARAITVQADDKIVVTGAAENTGSLDFAMVRYNADGSLDHSFGAAPLHVLAEDSSPLTLSDHGQFGFNDPDLGDSHTVSVVADAGNRLGGSLVAQVSQDTTGSGDGGLVDWTFSLDNSAAQVLGDGEQAVEHFTVSVDDGTGGVASRDVAVTITGVNDAPVFAAPIADQTALSRLAFSFTLAPDTFTDVDSASLSYSASLADGSALPAWLSFDPATQTFSGSPADTDLADLSVLINASDGGLSASGVFNLSVAFNTEYIGTSGDDTLTGTDANETFYGLAGNDTIDGGNGSDVMIGGAGDDTYFTDTGNVDALGNPTVDTIVETAGGGVDSVYSTYTYTLGSINDPVNGANNYVENLYLQSAAVKGTGNELDNYIEGNALANTLTGLAGNDTLNGGAGADTMVGGAGDDSYYVDNLGDKTTELAGGGNDTVFALINNVTLQANVENLNLTKGALAVTGTGNALANVITGNANANFLNGGAGNDTLIGGAGNDTLDGGSGADTMSGGTQNDTYFVDNIGDQVIESAGQANGLQDKVVASISYTLAANVEILALDTVANANLNATGNALANTITGNAGNNRIDGGLGNDQLTGGGGADQFVFSTALSAANVDTITDFSAASGDTIRLTGTIFAHLNQTNAVLNAADYHSGTGATLAATTANQHILFDTANGKLFYDADGSGAGTAVQFAQLSNVGTLTNAAFFVEGTSSVLVLDPGVPMLLG